MAKICKICKLEKELSDFPTRTIGSKDGTRGECKICYNLRLLNWAKKNQYKYQYRYHGYSVDHRPKEKIILSIEERVKKYKEKRFKQYNLTSEEYNTLLINQNNKCKICGEEFTKTPNIDHDHLTGKVRGLLCTRCNTVLGQCNDNVSMLTNMIRYLGE